MQLAPNDNLVLTSEAARLIGIAAATLRAWERRGIITAIRTRSGVRLFSRDEILQRAKEHRRDDRQGAA